MGSRGSCLAGLEPARVHLTWNQHVASILTYVYDRPAVHVKRYARGMEAFPIVGVVPARVWPATLELRQGDSAWLCGSYIEEMRGGRPKRLVPLCTDASPFSFGFLPSGAPAGPRVQLRAGSSLFGTPAGERGDGGTVRSTGEAGWLVRGPNVRIPRGTYRVSWSGRFEGTTPRTAGVPAASFEVRAGPKWRALARDEPSLLAGAFRVDLDFVLSDSASTLEFPVRVGNGVRMTLQEFHLAPLEGA